MSRRNKLKKTEKVMLWHPAFSGDGSAGHPIDVEDVNSAFFCNMCNVVDRDETHWEEGEHIHGADW